MKITIAGREYEFAIKEEIMTEIIQEVKDRVQLYIDEYDKQANILAEMIPPLKNECIAMRYPVGSIILMWNSVNPQSLLGGSWAAISKGWTIFFMSVGEGNGTWYERYYTDQNETSKYGSCFEDCHDELHVRPYTFGYNMWYRNA